MIKLFIYIFITLLWFIDGIIVILNYNDNDIKSLKKIFIITWITLICVLISLIIGIYLT